MRATTSAETVLDEKLDRLESAAEIPLTEAREGFDALDPVIGRAREEDEYCERETRSTLGAEPKAEEDDESQAK